MMIGAAVAPASSLVGRYVDTANTLDFIDDQAGLVVIKTHDAEEAAVRILHRRVDSILISIRDPRDCVTSLMIYQRYDVAQALEATERSARACARFAADPRAALLRYETGFIDQLATLDRIATCLGARLIPAIARIFADTRRSAIETHIARRLRCRQRCTMRLQATSWIPRRNGTPITPIEAARSVVGAICLPWPTWPSSSSGLGIGWPRSTTKPRSRLIRVLLA